MTLDTLLNLCDRYARMGSAIQEQLKAVAMDGADVADQNRNAMGYAIDFLRSCERLHVDGAAEMRDEIETELKKIEPVK